MSPWPIQRPSSSKWFGSRLCDQSSLISFHEFCLTSLFGLASSIQLPFHIQPGRVFTSLASTSSRQGFCKAEGHICFSLLKIRFSNHFHKSISTCPHDFNQSTPSPFQISLDVQYSVSSNLYVSRRTISKHCWLWVIVGYVSAPAWGENLHSDEGLDRFHQEHFLPH